MEIKKRFRWIILAWIISPLFAFGGELYRWTDERGTVHFTDDLGRIPDRFREDIREEKLPEEPPAPSISKTPRKIGPVESRKPATEEKMDLLGRGEEYWQSRMEEWNEKLLHAQKNYDLAFKAWKDKEKELVQSRFKPESLKRRLRTEVKALEGKAMEWKKQIEEAKRMLEKDIPGEAAKYQADPEWLKIKR